ncbi:MAG: 30S ribosomal protein S8 [Planctomycetota bacterium]
MMTDPIADMLTRIRNAVQVEKPFVDIPSSRFKKGIANVLKSEGFIWDWKDLEDEGPSPLIRLELKYGPNGERVIQSIRRVSKPGRRLYVRGKELKPVLGGLGIQIISTSKGVISDREARRENIGGEVLCEIA